MLKKLLMVMLGLSFIVSASATVPLSTLLNGVTQDSSTQCWVNNKPVASFCSCLTSQYVASCQAYQKAHGGNPSVCVPAIIFTHIKLEGAPASCHSGCVGDPNPGQCFTECESEYNEFFNVEHCSYA